MLISILHVSFEPHFPLRNIWTDSLKGGLWLRHCLNGRQDEYELVWPNLVFSLPTVERKAPVKENGMPKKEQ